MNQPFNDLNVLTKSLEDISNNYLDESLRTEFAQVYKAIEDKKIQIMFFGAYNSGKSTLINALLKQNSAQVNDIPTTDKIDIYDWKGFTLLDSPGVNAPIEHEEISKQQLERCNLIVFVIKETDQDTKDVYDRIFSLLENDKKIFIVLNYENEENILAIQEKVNEILIKWQSSGNYQVSTEKLKEIKILPINAKVALKAQLENKNLLLEHSNFVEFENHFFSWFEQFDNKTNLLESIKKQIKITVFNKLVDKLNVSDDSNGNLEQLQKLKREMSSTKSEVLFNTKKIIKDECSHAKNDIHEALQEEDAQKKIQKIAEDIFEKAYYDFSEKLVNAHKEFSNKEYSFSIKEGLKEESTVDKAINSAAKEGANYLRNNAENVVLAILKKGRKFKIPLLKGRWEKTLGKWAGKAGPWIQAAVGLIEVIIASDAEDKSNEARRMHQLSLAQTVEQITDEINFNITNDFEVIINESFKEQEDAIENEISEHINSLDSKKKDEQMIRRTMDEILMVSA